MKGRRMEREWSELQVINLDDHLDKERSTVHQQRNTGYQENQERSQGWLGAMLTALSVALVVITLPFSLFFVIKVVSEYERLVVFRLGRLHGGHGGHGPGLLFLLPCIDSYRKVDLRVVSVDVDPQEVLSSDSVTITVDAVLYYRVSQPQLAMMNVEDFGMSTRLLASTTLRNVLGTRKLAEIVADRENVAKAMQTALADATNQWGVAIDRVEIKDVRLPLELQRAMAAEAEAAREARAKVVSAEGEQEASKALKMAADLIQQSPAAIQLRYLQSLATVGDGEMSSTIVFPFPSDFVNHLIEN